jgi:iron(III)-enterobactin esterase
MAVRGASIKTRFWLSVGDQETDTDDPREVSQVVGVKNVCRILKSLGATIRYHEYHGGHDLKYWRAELEQALCWLLSGDNDASN